MSSEDTMVIRHNNSNTCFTESINDRLELISLFNLSQITELQKWI